MLGKESCLGNTSATGFLMSVLVPLRDPGGSTLLSGEGRQPPPTSISDFTPFISSTHRYIHPKSGQQGVLQRLELLQSLPPALDLGTASCHEMQPSSSCAAQCLTGRTTKSPVPTAECSHIKASKKLWTSGSPEEVPVPWASCSPFSYPPPPPSPWEDELFEEHLAV